MLLCLLFIIRVKREVKRVYRNGCRCNERLNVETGGSKTSRTHWVAPYYETIIIIIVFQKGYYESIKREPKIRGINKCRCDERLRTKEFTRLPYTGLVLELEHLKIETRLISERFANAMGECVVETMKRKLTILHGFENPLLSDLWLLPHDMSAS